MAPTYFESKGDKTEYIQLDITDKGAVLKVIAEVKPDAVIHCAAWTAVDAVEDMDNQEKVYAINYEGTKNIEVRGVNDQIGTPTYTKDLSRLLVDMVETDKYGYYHSTNEGEYTSWCDFCVEIYKQYGLDTKVTPVSTEEYGISKAKRPYNSHLDKSKLIENGFSLLPDWRDAVKRYLKEADL